MTTRKSYDAASLLNGSSIDDDFSEQIEKLKLFAVCNRPFIRVKKLKEWLRSRPEKKTHPTYTTHFERILRTKVYPSNLNIHYLSLLAEGNDAQDRSKSMDLVFSILMIIGCPRHVHHFEEWDIRDHSIPIRHLEDLKTKFGGFGHLSEQEITKYAEYFYCIQWSFVPVAIGKMRRRCDAPEIVPIHRRDHLRSERNGKPFNNGLTSQIFVVEVLEEFLEEELTSVIPDSRYDTKDGLGLRYRFVMKSLLPQYNDVFEQEVDNHVSLKSADGVIRYLGSFQHDSWPAFEHHSVQNNPNQSGKTVSCHIFLEYGVGDLLKLFELSPPSHPDEIRNFWRDMSHLAKALSETHNQRIDDQDIGMIHADIKPENIIIARNQLRLADLGFSKVFFKQRGIVHKSHIPGLTEVYAAPECMDENPNFTQAIDIWSLGCVFSIAATWLARGADAFYEYKDFRTHLTREYLQQSSPNTMPNRKPNRRPISQGDYFHDGKKLLPGILEWHELLRSCLRRDDHWTDRILDCVEKRMFESDPTSRITAKDLSDELISVIESDNSPLKIPDSLQSWYQVKYKEVKELISSDNLSGKIQNHPRLDVINSTRNLQAHRLQYTTSHLLWIDPMAQKTKNTHKAAESRPRPTIEVSKLSNWNMDKQRMNVEVVGKQDDNSSRRNGDLDAVEEETNLSIYDETSYSKVLQGVEPYNSAETSVDRRERVRQGISRPENAWQALGNMRREGKTSTKLFHRMFGSPTKDERLKIHFENRDIIFLVDNNATMLEFWDEATWLLEILLKKTEKFDHQSGKDIYFTCPSSKKYEVTGEKNIKALLQPLEMKDVIPSEERQGSLVKSFQRMFDMYLQSLDDYIQEQQTSATHSKLKSILPKRKSTEVKKEMPRATLICFTDGKWPGYQSLDHRRQYDNLVQGFVRSLWDRGITISEKNRPYSIELVSFGDDLAAIGLLEHLDDDLKHSGIPDVIDTEPGRGGDIYKILLGSVNDFYDRLDGEAAQRAQSQLASPSSAGAKRPLRSPTVGEGPANSQHTDRPGMDSNRPSSPPPHFPILGNKDDNSQSRKPK